MKKSTEGGQVLDLNRIDFEKTGTARKAGYKFTIHFNEGKISNVISGSALGRHLATIMQEDEGVRKLLAENNYSIELNTRFQLIIKNVAAEESKPLQKKNKTGG
ncbi:MAG TPA: hypothetical protein VG847_11270 [Chitinophagaceae bacterium]|nr:hypothetical protein [Chitinophagaceae bacterium]